MAEMIILGVFVIMSFIIGALIGQKVAMKEKITLNPVKVVQENKEEHEVKKEIKHENDKYDTMLRNIDKYDGSGIGQEDIPE